MDLRELEGSLAELETMTAQQKQRLEDARVELNATIETLNRLEGGKQILRNLIESEKKALQAKEIADAVEQVSGTTEPTVVGPIPMLDGTVSNADGNRV